jgi:hypothetical protein
VLQSRIIDCFYKGCGGNDFSSGPFFLGLVGHVPNSLLLLCWCRGVPVHRFTVVEQWIVQRSSFAFIEHAAKSQPHIASTRDTNVTVR